MEKFSIKILLALVHSNPRNELGQVSNAPAIFYCFPAINMKEQINFFINFSHLKRLNKKPNQIFLKSVLKFFGYRNLCKKV